MQPKHTIKVLERVKGTTYNEREIAVDTLVSTPNWAVHWEKDNVGKSGFYVVTQLRSGLRLAAFIANEIENVAQLATLLAEIENEYPEISTGYFSKSDSPPEQLKLPIAELSIKIRSFKRSVMKLD